MHFGNPAQTTLFLNRTPVSAIASVTVDDIVLDPSAYRLDHDAGLLDRLSTDGFTCAWCFCKSVIVAYTGGTDPTPAAASTFGKKVNWIAIGS